MSSSPNSSSAQVDDSDDVIATFSSLLTTGELVDVIFQVGDSQFPAHRFILSARNEYFKTMFSSNFREASEKVVEIKGASPVAFEQILKYLYTGQVDLLKLKIPETMELVKIAHLYQIPKLLSAITKYLLEINGVANACQILCLVDTSASFLSDVIERCLDVIDVAASTVFKSAEFKLFPLDLLLLVLKRKTLIAPEIEVFKAACLWLQVNKVSNKEKTQVKNSIQLKLLNDVDILTTVKQSNLFSIDVLFDALASIKLNPSANSGHRIPVPKENVATVKAGAKVTGGTAVPQNSDANSILADYSNNRYYGNNRYLQHKLGDEKGITIKLDRLYAIEKLSLEVPYNSYNFDTEEYPCCCYVETSTNGSSWTRVALTNKRDEYNSRNLQMTFRRRAVMYIRIVGLDSQDGKSFIITRIFNVC